MSYIGNDLATDQVFLPDGIGAVSRTIPSKLKDTVSVKDFGAVGDGVANDTAAIQAAINTGKKAYLPKGTYAISTLYFNANGQGLIGESPSSTQLISNVSSVAGTAIANNSPTTTTRLFCTIENLQVNTASLAVGFAINWTSFQFGCIKNVWVYGGGSGCTGILLSANWTVTECTYNDVQDCYVGNVGKGISFGDGANTNTLINNRIQPLATGYGYFLFGTATGRVSNNTIVGGGVEFPGVVSKGVYAGTGVDGLLLTGVRFEALAIAIESTSTATGLTLIGNYYSSNTSNYAITSTNTNYLEGSGLVLPNVAAAGTSTLDYYLRGTFSPTIIGGTTAGTGTYTLAYGSYTRIGNRVQFECEITWTAHTGTGNLLLSNLPFAIKNQPHGFPVTVAASNLTFTGQLAAIAIAGTSNIGLYSVTTNAAASALAMDTAATLYVSGSYSV